MVGAISCEHSEFELLAGCKELHGIVLRKVFSSSIKVSYCPQ